MTFQNKVVMITGASAGIGESLAREIASRGGRLVLAARRTDRLVKLVQEIGESRALAVTCDVSKDGELEKALALAVKTFGGVDVVVANAGFSVAGSFDRLSVEDYRRQFETNFFGVLRTAKAAIAELKKSRGVLVLIGSVNSYLSAPGASAYCASKFALRGLADGIRPEWQSAGVAVTLICPGFVESEIRHINSRGELTDAKDPVPSWLVMSSKKAARQIALAIERRVGEVVITGHGKFGVWVIRHFPWVVRLVFRSGFKWDPEAARK